MNAFLKSIFQFTKFSSVEIQTKFRPRRIGLGYDEVQPETIVSPLVKEIKREGMKMKRREERKRKEESSEEISKFAHINRKGRK